jgi:hypothetical protein
MHGLSIRKIPGVGRVKERLLESIGVKVRRSFLDRTLCQLAHGHTFRPVGIFTGLVACWRCWINNLVWTLFYGCT